MRPCRQSTVKPPPLIALRSAAPSAHKRTQPPRSASAQLRRLVSAHQAAAARLVTAELQIGKARAAGLAQISSHLRELRAELDSWWVACFAGGLVL